MFLLETVEAAAFGSTLDAAADGLTGLLAGRSRSLAVYQITPADPATPELDAALLPRGRNDPVAYRSGRIRISDRPKTDIP